MTLARFRRRVFNGVIIIRAERAFREEAVKLCTPITAEVLEEMALKKSSVAALMKQSGHSFPAYKPNPGVDYLMSLSNADLVALLEQDLPRHVAVLRKYPEFCAQFIGDLKRLAGAAAQR